MAGLAVILFSDLVSSTSLLARLGDDRMEQLRSAHISDVRAAVDADDGQVVKTLGDGAMAQFGSALGALRAAARIQHSVYERDLEAGGVGLAARVGLAAGEPIADEGDIHGMSVVIASRLCDLAPTGGILVHELVASLVASRTGIVFGDRQSWELRGVPQPIEARLLHHVDASVPTGQPEAPRQPEIPRHEDSTGQRVPLPSLLASYAAEPLIGRDAEITRIAQISAPGPGVRVALVLGEPGIGKTRHASAAAEAAWAAGSTVLLARCPPEPMISFEPWIRGVGELVRSTARGPARERLARAAGAELAALVPEFGDDAPAERTSDAAPDAGRYRMLSGLSALLETASAGESLTIVFDDAHWCDAASAQAFAHILGSAPAAGLRVIVTARGREFGRGHVVARVLRDLRRTAAVEELRLSGLDAAGVASLVAARVGGAITGRVAARLLARTGGNPFFAGELARDLDAEGRLRDEQAIASADVPDVVADLVEERLERLSEDARSLLTAAAAIGPTAPVLLAARVAGLDDDRAAAAVAEAISERLVDEVAGAERRIEFPHALVHEALAHGEDAMATARLHNAIATALEADEASEPAQLARHRTLAVAVTGPGPAVHALRTAADTAAASHAHEDAADHLEAAAVLLRDAAERLTLLLGIGDQRLLAGDLRRGRVAYLEAAATARTLHEPQAFAEAALGIAGGEVGFGYELTTLDETVPLLEEALDVLGQDDPGMTLRVCSRLLYLLAYTDDQALLLSIVHRARTAAISADDPLSRLCAHTCDLLASIVRSDAPLSALSKLVDAADEWLALAHQSGRLDFALRGERTVASVRMAAGDVEGSNRALREVERLAELIGSPRFAWEAPLARASQQRAAGDFEHAQELLDGVGAILRQLRPDLHVLLSLQEATLRAWIFDGQPGAVRRVFEAYREVQDWGLARAFLAFIAAIEGDYPDALKQLAQIRDTGLESIRQPDVHLPVSLAMVACACSEVDDVATAEWVLPYLRQLQQLGHESAVAVPNVVDSWSISGAIGAAQRVLGEYDEAVTSLRRGLATMERIGGLLQTEITRLELARALHARGDDDEAWALLEETREHARRVGARWILTEADRVAVELGGKPRPRPVRDERRVRRARAFSARTGRRALAAFLGSQDDAELERRFASPARQRRLIRASIRAFQPDEAEGFSGVIAYELEPFAIKAPPDAPWRWAIAIDGEAARLIEPAPIDADVTLHFGLADWLRVTAGTQDPLVSMAAGRCMVEGDVLVAARIEAMFGGPGR